MLLWLRLLVLLLFLLLLVSEEELRWYLLPLATIITSEELLDPPAKGLGLDNFGSNVFEF